jgi:DNA-binding protein
MASKLASNDSIIFVGNKQPMKYVLGVITQFQNGAKEVSVKARGRLISRAVDVVEILRNKLMKDVKVGSIEISTEVIEGERGKVNVSVINIPLKKK